MESIFCFLAPLAVEIAAAGLCDSPGACTAQLTQRAKQLSFLSDVKLVRSGDNFHVFSYTGQTIIVAFRADNSLMQTTMETTSTMTYTVDGTTYTREAVFLTAPYEIACACVDRLMDLLQKVLDGTWRVIFTGHGVGGTVAAMASVYAFFKLSNARIWKPLERTAADGQGEEDTTLAPREFTCFTFGSPVPGSRRLASVIESMGIRRLFYHFVNARDPAPTVYRVMPSTWTGTLLRAAGYLYNGGVTRALVGYAAPTWKFDPDCQSPCFGTYVTLVGGDEVKIGVERDRVKALESLREQSNGDPKESSISAYQVRVHEVRAQQLAALWNTSGKPQLRLPNDRHLFCYTQWQSWREKNGNVTVTVAYDLRDRAVFAVNRTSKEYALCFFVQRINVLHLNTKCADKLQPVNADRLHIHVKLPPQSMRTIMTLPLYALGEAYECETELVSETALADVDRSLLPCLQQIMSHVTPTLHAFVYVTLKALPDDGLRQVVLRHNARSALTFVLTLPKEHFEKLSFQLTNCTAVRRASSSDADLVEMHVTVPANVSGGYAVLAEYVTGEVGDWELARISAATPSVSASPRQSTPSSPPSSPSSPAVRPLAPTKLSLSDRAFLLRLEAKWKIKRLFKGY